VPPFAFNHTLPPTSQRSRAGQRFTTGPRNAHGLRLVLGLGPNLSGAAGNGACTSGPRPLSCANDRAQRGDHVLITDSVYEPSRTFAVKLCVAWDRDKYMIRPSRAGSPR